jgi:glycine cleavage system H protein
MCPTVRTDRRYLETHEWARRKGNYTRIGITDFVQSELGEIVFVELPSVGEYIDSGSAFSVIESVKSISDVYAPISGVITNINYSVVENPTLLNNDPFDDGWMIEIDPNDTTEFEELLLPGAYESQIM